MASRYYGINKGQHEPDATEGSSDLTKDVQIVVNLASFTDKGKDRNEVVALLEHLVAKIMKDIWPPA